MSLMFNKWFSLHWRWCWFTDILYRRVDWQMNLRRPRVLVLPGAYEINVWPLTLIVFRRRGTEGGLRG